MARQPKPVSAATRRMLDEMEQDAAAGPPEDKLAKVHAQVAALRDAELRKDALSESLKQTNIEINDLLWTKIPTVMDEAQMLNCTIQADGNLPPYTVKVEDEYKANIPGEHAEAAYDFLKKRGEGDLIKVTYEVSFGLGEEKAAERFERSLEKAGIMYTRKRGVPWNSLTAWFREEYKEGIRRKKPFPQKAMTLLGATVRRVAKVVKQKEKK